MIPSCNNNNRYIILGKERDLDILLCGRGLNKDEELFAYLHENRMNGKE